MITDGHRFAAIFTLAAILIGATFALYMTHSDSSKEKKVAKEKAAYENQDYGFRVLYSKAFKANETAAAQGQPFSVGFSENAENAKIFLTIQVEPQRLINTCAKLKGRVEGTIAIGTSASQPCMVPATTKGVGETLHIETSHNKKTYTITADNYIYSKTAVQGILATLQFIQPQPQQP